MTRDKIKKVMDACYLAKRARDLLPKLPILHFFLMYSRNFLNEIFRDGFLLYNDIFAARTRCVRRENGSSISKIQPKGFV